MKIDFLSKVSKLLKAQRFRSVWECLGLSISRRERMHKRESDRHHIIGKVATTSLVLLAIFSTPAYAVQTGTGDEVVTTGNFGVGTALPRASIEIGTGTYDNVDGVNDLFVQDDIEVDGIIYGDGSGITNVSAAGWSETGADVYLTTSTDNVGIGTIDPTANLEIILESGDAPFMVSADATGDGDWLIVTSVGNVGIGTADAANANLEITADVTTGDAVYIDATTVTTGEGLEIIINSATMDNSSGGRVLRVGLDDGTEQLYLTEFGGLWANHVINSDTDTTGNLRLGEDADAYLGYDGNNFVVNPRVVGSGDSLFTSGNIGIGTDAKVGASLEIIEAGEVTFAISSDPTGDGDLFVVTSNGSVGVGTSLPITSTQIGLNVAGNAPNLILEDTGVAVGSDGRLFRFENDAAFLRLYESGRSGQATTGSTELVTVEASSGNVGIGSAIPLAHLHVGAGDPDESVITDTNDVYIADDLEVDGAIYGDGSQLSGVIGNPLSSDLDLGGFMIESTTDGIQFDSDDDATADVIILANTNVGFGTLIPQALVEIDQQATSSHPFMVSSDATSDGDMFIVQEDGNVGVGTITPSQKFEVEDGGFQISINNEAAGGRRYMLASSDNSWGVGGGRFSIYDGDAFVHRLAIDSSGNVGIGTTSPLAMFVVGDGNPDESVITDTNDVYIADDLEVDGAIYGDGSQLTGILTNPLSADLDVNGFMIESTTDGIQFDADDDATADVVILSDGNFGVGSTVPTALFTVTGDNRDIHHYSYSASDGDGPEIEFRRAKGTSGSPTIVDDGTELGSIMFRGWDGNSWEGVGWIKTFVDGTAADESVPSRMEFWTSEAGTATMYQRLVIDTDGNVGVGSTLAGDPTGRLEVVSEGTTAFMISSDATADGDYMTVTSVGNVGIGTSVPLAAFVVGDGNPDESVITDTNDVYIADDLEVDGAIYGDGSQLTGILTNPMTADLDLGGFMLESTTNGIQFDSDDDATADVIILANTNVGFGTLIPQALVEIDQQATSSHPFMISSDATSDGDLIMLTSEGNLGIGDATPDARLEIEHTTSGHAFIVSDSLADSTPFVINDTGNVGISTAEPVANSRVTISGVAMGQLVINNPNSGSENWRIASSATGWSSGAGRFIIGNNTVASAGAFYITSAYNVGIGTHIPLAHFAVGDGDPDESVITDTNDVYIADDLEVDGAIYGDGSQLTGILTNPMTADLDLGGFMLESTTNGIQLDSDDDATADVIILANTNVGFGTLIPQALFEIDQQATSSHPFMISSDATSDGDYLFVQSDGNLGIGATAPTNLFTVEGNVFEMGMFRRTGSGSARITLEDSSGDASSITQDLTDNALYFTVNSAERVRFSPAGNVGIGSTVPLAQLHIGTGDPDESIITGGNSGDVYIADDLEVDGAIYGDGSQLTGILTNPLSTDLDVNGFMIESTTDGIQFDADDDATADVVILSNTNVGFGTLIPQALFEIDQQATSSHLMMVSSDATSDGDIFLITSAGNVGINTATAGRPLVIEGNIGIGTTNVIYLGADRFLWTMESNSNNAMFFGVDAGNLSATGAQNTAMGFESMRDLTTGTSNTAVGYQTLRQIEDGGSNTAVGRFTASNVTDGFDNTAMGRNALDANVSGNRNTAIGAYSLDAATSDYNTALGRSAGQDLVAGTYNLFLGYDTDAVNTGATNAIAIGANSLVNANNALALGGQGTFSVNVGIGTGDPSATVEIIDGDLGPFMISSDATADGDIMTITSAGNTGIGEASPLALLAVGSGNPDESVIGTGGDVYISDDLEVDGAIYGDGSQLTGVLTNPMTADLDLGGFMLESTTNGIQFDSDDDATADVIILANTNVGFGTLIPQALVEIDQQATSSHPFMISSDATSDGDYLFVQSDGNVGIATTIPTSALTVSGIIESPSTVDNVLITNNATLSQSLIDSGSISGDVTFVGVNDDDDGVFASYVNALGGWIGFKQLGGNGFYGVSYSDPFATTITYSTGMFVDESSTEIEFWGNSDYKMVISDVGNVGIGTGGDAVEPRNTAKLDLTTNVASDGININNIAANGDPRIAFQLSDTSIFTLGVDDSDSDKFKIGTTAITTNTRMTIDGSGNVGIGSTIPLAQLHVGTGDPDESVIGTGGDVYIADDLEVDGAIYGDGSQLTGILTNPLSTDLDVNGFMIESTTDGIQFDADDDATADVVILSNTNVGLGTLIPQALFEIDQQATSSHPFMISSDATSDGDLLVLSSSGNLGLGIEAPTDWLHIDNSDNNEKGISVINNTNGTDAAAEFAAFGSGSSGFFGAGSTNYTASPSNAGRAYAYASAGTGLSLVASGSGDDIRLYTNGDALTDEQVRITSAGNVGIGSTVPLAHLHVGTGDPDESVITDTNDVYIADDLEVDGAIYGDGSQLTGILTNPLSADLDVNGFMIESTTDGIQFDADDDATADVVILSNTNVGLGTLIPQALLEIDQQATSSHLFMISSDATSDGDILAVLSNGNIGIGEPTAANANLEITTTATSGHGVIIDGQTLTSGDVLQIHPQSALSGDAFRILRDGGTEVFSINANGLTTTESVFIADIDNTAVISIGEDEDATIGYNGVNMVVNPQAQGSGNLLVTAGNVGITTTDANATLHVGDGDPDETYIGSGGDVYITDDLEVDGAIYGDGSQLTGILANPLSADLDLNGFMIESTTDGIQFDADDDATADVVILSNTNIGVGTLIPQALVEIDMQGGSSHPFMISSDATSDGDFFYVDSGGNIGIGTFTPSSLLDVETSSGLSQITIDGPSGGCLMFRDTDDAGWTECYALNGTLTCSVDADGVCDGS